MCKHHICNQLRLLGAAFSALALLRLSYNNHKNGKKYNVFLLGKERSGNYAGEFSLPGGKGDKKDAGCWMSLLRRELEQELKIKMDWKMFDAIFRDEMGLRRFQVVLIGRSPVFFGFLPLGFSRSYINPAIKACIGSNLPWEEQELSEVDYFREDNYRTPEGRNRKISSFAMSAIQRIKNWNNVLSI